MLLLVAGCGKKMVESGSQSDHYSRSGDSVDAVQPYGQMGSHAAIMKDGLPTGDRYRLGESTLSSRGSGEGNMVAHGKAPRTGKGVGLESASPSGGASSFGSALSEEELGKDGPVDVVTMRLDSVDHTNKAGLSGKPGNVPGALDNRRSFDRLPGEPFPTSRHLRDVHFEFDSWRLSDDAREILEANAEWLIAHPHEHITIEGHCDERGTQSYNYVLGEKRAAMVQQYLSFLGVPLNQLYVASYGKDRPACRTLSDDCFDQNRRAHFNASMNMVSQHPHEVTR